MSRKIETMKPKRVPYDFEDRCTVEARLANGKYRMVDGSIVNEYTAIKRQQHLDQRRLNEQQQRKP